MSNFKINIVLTKAEWCGHCIHFTPIFKKAIELKEDDDEDFYKDITLVEFL